MPPVLQQQVQRQSTANAYTRDRWIGLVKLTVVVGVAYFLAALLSILMAAKIGAGVFYPAAGISAGTLIALGRDARWPVAVATIAATIAANLMGGRNVWFASITGLCNGGEALLVAWLIEHYFGRDFSLARFSHVLGFLGTAFVSTAVSGGRAT